MRYTPTLILGMLVLATWGLGAAPVIAATPVYHVTPFGGPAFSPGHSSDHGPCPTFLARDGITRPLDELIDQAVAINDSGQSAGDGCSSTHGCMIVRLDPVPEPAAYVMLLAGVDLQLVAPKRAPRR